MVFKMTKYLHLVILVVMVGHGDVATTVRGRGYEEVLAVL